ncbi:MAG: hypothetical protein RL190_1582 [Actinomycetota bacterium]|jgi:hypothetical protein
MPRRLERQTRRPGKGAAAAFCLVAALLVGYVGVASLRDGATATGLVALTAALGLAASAAALARARRGAP